MISALIRSAQQRLENPANTLDEAAYEEATTTGTDSGVRVTRDTILGHPAVWSSIRRISSTIGMLPLDIYRRDGEDETLDNAHPLHRILSQRPDVELTPFTLKQRIVHDLLLGNAYVYVWRDGAGRPVGMWPLDPTCTVPVRQNNRLYYGTVIPITNQVRKLDPRNVIHCKGLSWDCIEGYDVVRTLRHAFALGLGQRKYRGIYFRNNGRPNVALEAPPELTEEARERLVKSWRRAASGLENAHRAVLLEEGVKVHEYGSSAKDSQLLNAEEHELVQIANIFSIPPSRLGAKTNVSYKSLEQDNKLYFNDGILPLVTLIEEEMNEKLRTNAEIQSDSHVIKFDRNEFEWADMATRFSAYNIGIQGGWLNRDEVRRFENLNAIPDGAGKPYFVPQNVAITGEDGTVTPVNQPAEEEPEEDTEEAKDPEEEPTEEESEDDTEDERTKALDAILRRDIGRMVGRVSVATAKVARKETHTFIAALNDLEKSHSRTVREAISEPARAIKLDPETLVARFFERSKATLLELAGEHSDGESLSRSIERWGKHPGDWIDAVIKGNADG